jgi:adenylate cyclase
MSNADATKSTIGELRRLEDQVDQTIASLTTQKEVLKKRGMNLPPMVIDTLGAIKRDMSNVESILVDEQTELSQLRALADMSAKITTSLDIDTVLQETMEIVIALTQAERGYIILKNMDTEELEFRVTNESGVFGTSVSASTGERPQISMSIVNEVIDTRDPLLADNAFKDERLQGNVSIANFALRSVLCVPLNYKGNTIGVVYVDNRLQAGIFTKREKTLLEAFANTAAVAIANARMYTRTENILEEMTRVKELMDNIFSSIGSGIIAADSADAIRTFNRAAGEILSLPMAEAIGQSIKQVLQGSSLQIADQLTAVKEEDTKQTIEMTIDLEERGRKMLNLTMAPLKDANNQTHGITVVMDDVTHLQEHEQTINAMKRILPPEMVDNISDIANIQLGGVRREVTCLFADVRPLITLQDIPPSEKLTIINQYQAVATACIHEAGGIIDKYMGNEVMALFNTQLNPEDNHAQQALECGLTMRDRFIQLYEQLGINPDPHYYIIGMFTGEATLGNVGSFNRREFTAIGNTINTSKRVEENAARGTITIVQQTYDHIQANHTGDLAYDFRDRDPIFGKGLSEGMRAYEVYRL